MRLALLGRYLCCLGFLQAQPALASLYHDYNSEPEDGALDPGSYLDRWNLPFIPVPKIITEPAVGTGLGLAMVFFHESDEQKAEKNDDKLVPENISLAGLAFTSNGSRGYGLAHLGFWRDDSIRYRGFLAYSDFNIDFYSFAGLPLSNGVGLNIRGPVMLQDLKLRVPGTPWFLGVKQLYRKVSLSLEDEIPLPNPALQQKVNDYLNRHLGEKGTTSGLGLVAEFDSRDSPIDPQRGFNYGAQYMRFDDALGSDYDYASYRIKGLNYWVLSPALDLGVRLQYDGISVNDDVLLPPYIPPSINLRGIPASRYQGNAVAVTEAELTWKVKPRWRLKGFVGTGRAADKFNELGEADAANSIGGGFRYMVAERYGFAMGVDVARGPEESAVYIQAGSTW
tara:strand:- start:2039 stop:3223 length:1185 start_codon:yes stop_codon:yes gene_type:complete